MAAVVALVGGLLLTPARPAAVAAEAPARTHCTFTAAIALVPGLSVVPSSGTFSSGGETGTVSCDGPVRGIVPTGPGTLGVEGRYGTKDPDTCQGGGEGDGRFVVTIPTDAGDQRFAALFTFTYGEPSTRGGVVAGRFEGDGFHGTFDATPKEGDCVTRPVTRIHTVDEIHLEDAFFAHS